MAFRKLSNIPGTQGSPLEENGHTQQCLDATDSLFFRASAAQVWGNSRTRCAKQPYHYYFSTSLSRNPKKSLIYPHPNHPQNAKRRGGTSNRLSTGTTPGRRRRYPGCGAQKPSLQAAANRAAAGSATWHSPAGPGAAPVTEPCSCSCRAPGNSPAGELAPFSAQIHPEPPRLGDRPSQPARGPSGLPARDPPARAGAEPPRTHRPLPCPRAFLRSPLTSRGTAPGAGPCPVPGARS